MRFENDYYVKSNISNYTDYRTKKFEQLASDLVAKLPIQSDSKILDFGAATGGLVHALKVLGISNVIGTDISYWAIEHGRKQYELTSNELQFYNRQLLEGDFDFITLLDVLEHIETDELEMIIKIIKCKQLVVRIPVAYKEGDDYVLDVSKNDKTHIQVHSKVWWRVLFARFGYFIFSPLDTSSIYDSIGVMAGVFKNVSMEGVL